MPGAGAQSLLSREAVLPSTPFPLNFPECDRGIGSVIQTPDSPDLIEGVRVRPVSLWPDDRGYFLELIRIGQGFQEPMPAMQVSATVSYLSTIKAFHYHMHQTDLWVPVKGMFQVALVDLRQQSATFGRRNTMYIGSLRPWQLEIPPGVGHGYKVVGSEPAVLVYITDRIYNPSDEGRIPYNHPGIAYDWETQHK